MTASGLATGEKRKWAPKDPFGGRPPFPTPEGVGAAAALGLGLGPGPRTGGRTGAEG